jgi:hypothetical protein
VNEFMIVRRGIGAVQTVGEGRNLLVPFKNDGTVANANVTNNISLIKNKKFGGFDMFNGNEAVARRPVLIQSF